MKKRHLNFNNGKFFKLDHKLNNYEYFIDSDRCWLLKVHSIMFIEDDEEHFAFKDLEEQEFPRYNKPIRLKK